MSRTKKLIIISLVIGLVIGGIWFYEEENSSLSNNRHPAKNAPLIGKDIKNDIPKSHLDNKMAPADIITPINPNVVVTPQTIALPVKIMTKKPDPALLGNVSSFNFNDLYLSLQDPKIDNDLNILDLNINKFIKDYKGKVGKLKAIELLNAIKRFEVLQETQYRISEMSSLSRDLNVTNIEASKAYARMEQKNADFNTKTTFFMLEIIKIPDLKLKTAYKDKTAQGLLKYKPFLDNVRKFAKYTLSEDLEKMSIQKNITANEAWATLYSNILSTISFNIDGEAYNLSQAFPLITSPDHNIRKNVTEEIGKALKKNAITVTASLNSIIKDKKLEDKMRGFSNPISQRNLQNGVEDAVVNNLITTVKSNYPKTIQRYYKIKAKMLGLPKLHYSDRLAPMPFDATNANTINWDQAKNTVVDAYRQFSPIMSTIAEKFFSNGWIDGRLLDHKVGGAYCDPGVPSNHPYILLNYNGRNEDVLSIAHEVGHGIHSILSYPNGMLMFSPGLTVAEIASLFGENLTFDSLIKKAITNKEKAVLLAHKIESAITTVITAVAVADFENQLHMAANKSGDLSTEDINAIWTSSLKEAYGDTVEMGEFDAYRWMSIGHIFRSPFYYYAYPFSQLMVNSLYNVYNKNIVANFQDKMITLLSSGNTKKYNDLLTPFGLDANNTSFWQDGMDVIIKMIDDFENLINHDPEIQALMLNVLSNINHNNIAISVEETKNNQSNMINPSNTANLNINIPSANSQIPSSQEKNLAPPLMAAVVATGVNPPINPNPSSSTIYPPRTPNLSGNYATASNNTTINNPISAIHPGVNPDPVIVKLPK